MYLCVYIYVCLIKWSYQTRLFQASHQLLIWVDLWNTFCSASPATVVVLRLVFSLSLQANMVFSMSCLYQSMSNWLVLVNGKDYPAW